MTGWPPGTSDLLLKQRMTEDAVQVWASYLGRRRGDYPNSNLLFNGDFENAPTGGALDWRITAVRGAEAADSGEYRSDPVSGLPHAVMETRQQDQGRGVAG